MYVCDVSVCVFGQWCKPFCEISEKNCVHSCSQSTSEMNLWVNQFVGLSVHYAQPRMNLRMRASPRRVLYESHTHTRARAHTVCETHSRERCNISHQYIYRLTRIHRHTQAGSIDTLVCLFHSIPRISSVYLPVFNCQTIHMLYTRSVWVCGIHANIHLRTHAYRTIKCLAESMLPQTTAFTVA